MQEQYDKLSRLISEYTRAFSVLERKYKSRLPVTIQQTHILEAVSKYEQISVKGLSAYLGISISAMSRNIDKLVEKGLLQKRSDTADARIMTISLSEKGQEMFAEIELRKDAYFKQIFSHLAPDKIPEYIDICKKLLSATEKAYLRRPKPKP